MVYLARRIEEAGKGKEWTISRERERERERERVVSKPMDPSLPFPSLPPPALLLSGMALLGFA
jgi:hypothetical protein